jgi:low affinity Fe/Cu permease
MNDRLTRAFTPIAQGASRWTGSPYAFILAVLSVVLWACSGPLFHFSQTWQLVINTGTTIMTFLMVFLIQHTTNAGTVALHLKLDALLKADARDDDERFVGIEDLTAPEIQILKHEARETIEEIRARRNVGH